MYQNCCKKCGSTDLYTNQKGNNTGLYCSDCGAWIKCKRKIASTCSKSSDVR